MTPVQEAYGARADEYIDRFGSIEANHPTDRELVTRWAAGVHGRILDLGCGPGQWTHLLQVHGCEVYGVDPVPAFVEHARGHFPDVVYAHGTAQHLDEPDGALAGVLAWYSLIHLPPRELDDVLTEVARCVRPGGGLLLGFFEGPTNEPFDHAIVTAHWWPIAELSARVRQAGFTVTETHTRTDPGRRPHGAIAAVRGPHIDQDQTAPHRDQMAPDPSPAPHTGR